MTIRLIQKRGTTSQPSAHLTALDMRSQQWCFEHVMMVHLQHNAQPKDAVQCCMNIQPPVCSCILQPVPVGFRSYVTSAEDIVI